MAENLNGLAFDGTEASILWLPAKAESVRVSWSTLHGAQNALHGLQSEYLLNYPVQNVRQAGLRRCGFNLVITNAVQIAQRYQHAMYPVWNASLLRDRGTLRPYVRINNVSTGYQEISGSTCPGEQSWRACQFGFFARTEEAIIRINIEFAPAITP